jgi:hypothetical protein
MAFEPEPPAAEGGPVPPGDEKAAHPPERRATEPIDHGAMDPVDK